MIRNVEADSAISWLGNRNPQPSEKTISWKDILQLGKGGMDDPSGGLPSAAIVARSPIIAALRLIAAPPYTPGAD